MKEMEAPELTLIGRADDVVLGLGGAGNDGDTFEYGGLDFEFEQD
ncbi:MAG TPA: hypothetical protein VLU73_06345 [Methylococcaceae bacterium]|nr:hypothetical protein [Methylococcaceae bacterium]